jgi:5-methylcytosine-specific restriction endonuclease McrA
MSTILTPVALQLWENIPFVYTQRAISELSATEAFETGIDKRDEGKCVICGTVLAVQHCHIVPKVEPDTVRVVVYTDDGMLSYFSHINTLVVARVQRRSLYPSERQVCRT